MCLPLRCAAAREFAALQAEPLVSAPSQADATIPFAQGWPPALVLVCRLAVDRDWPSRTRGLPKLCVLTSTSQLWPIRATALAPATRSAAALPPRRQRLRDSVAFLLGLPLRTWL